MRVATQRVRVVADWDRWDFRVCQRAHPEDRHRRIPDHIVFYQNATEEPIASLFLTCLLSNSSRIPPHVFMVNKVRYSAPIFRMTARMIRPGPCSQSKFSWVGHLWSPLQGTTQLDGAALLYDWTMQVKRAIANDRRLLGLNYYYTSIRGGKRLRLCFSTTNNQTTSIHSTPARSDIEASLLVLALPLRHTDDAEITIFLPNFFPLCG